MKTAADILEFWFSDRVKARWFNSTAEFDAEIITQFGDTSEMLATAPFPHSTWGTDPDSALALIIALDQFPRNMFRGAAEAFQWDALSLGVAASMIDDGWDMEIPAARRAFVYMPFMHAEDLAAQNRCVELSGSRFEDGGSTLRHAKAHRDVIEQFGRFPHRNATLGRESTREEREFLKRGGYDPS
ncbi:hypothetical protein GCM10009069_21840 [Algimonas arctica]|uniref:DUF924 domain-containing protein n=1 Tax=Algimonas arctica TaxID=1479486 RepID=A0A8J3CTT1_9PROT|nr:DUF924 family protein [Algimonas arctica]GHA98558.1 hypothetical protein GCM10009069_21840 [Algimonas arctica]